METWRHISKKKALNIFLSWLEQSVINILPKDINHGALVSFASFRYLQIILFPLWCIKIIWTCHKTLNCIEPSIYFFKACFYCSGLNCFLPKAKIIDFYFIRQMTQCYQEVSVQPAVLRQNIYSFENSILFARCPAYSMVCTQCLNIWWEVVDT